MERFNWSDWVSSSSGKTIWHLDKIIAHVAERLKGVEAIYLFGSRAYNTGSLRSDIDLLVYAENQVDLSVALAIQDDFPPLDIFRTRDHDFAESVVNGSRIKARKVGDLVSELDAIPLWDNKCGLNSAFDRWEQSTRPDIRFSKTVAELPRSFGTKIFIGHGRASDWVMLKEYIVDILHLECDSFEAQAVGGYDITERLEEMLRDARFAFLVATAEDEDVEHGRHARENVIHEIGLFQGRLGTRKAIILMEEHCSVFSNIAGVIHVSFRRGAINLTFDVIRSILEREGILRSDS